MHVSANEGLSSPPSRVAFAPPPSSTIHHSPSTHQQPNPPSPFQPSPGHFHPIPSSRPIRRPGTQCGFLANTRPCLASLYVALPCLASSISCGS
jgi:hypothetical protein